MTTTPSGVWVYKQSEPRLWTVGHYDGDGKWQPESDHPSSEEAAQRVRWLSGAPEEAALRLNSAQLADLRRMLGAMPYAGLVERRPYDLAGFSELLGWLDELRERLEDVAARHRETETELAALAEQRAAIRAFLLGLEGS